MRKKYRQIGFQMKQAVKYYLLAGHRKGHGIHSPFIYTIVRNVILHASKHKKAYQWISHMQRCMYKRQTMIHTAGAGAGSRIKQGNKIRAGKLAQTSGLPYKYLRLLTRLTQYTEAGHILELGTCCGLTSAVLAAANPQAMVHTVEGNSERLQFAQHFFTEKQLDNIRVHHSTFEYAIQKMAAQNIRYQMIFIDGDHCYDALLKNFRQLMPLLSKDGVIVIDDIYWSADMTRAWQDIKQNTPNIVTLDLFRLGIVFFRSKQAKQHFTVRY